MDERRRFALALGGVAGSLGLAAAIAITGPATSLVPPVPIAPVALGEPLPGLPLPAWVAPPGPRPASRRSAAVVARPPAGTPVAPLPARALPNALSPRGVVARAALHSTGDPAPYLVPRAVGLPSVSPVADARPRRRAGSRRPGVVSGAFATAGHQVGASVKTVGRALKKLF